MQRADLLRKVKQRRKELGITLQNLSILSNVGFRTLTRFLAGEDVKLSTVEKVTNVLGLDFAGNGIIDTQTLKEKRAEQRAIYIVSLVQDTSSLEEQGLDTKEINILISEAKKEFLSGANKTALWDS